MNQLTFLDEQNVSFRKELQLQNLSFKRAEKDYFLELKVSVNYFFLKCLVKKLS